MTYSLKIRRLFCFGLATAPGFVLANINTCVGQNNSGGFRRNSVCRKKNDLGWNRTAMLRNATQPEKEAVMTHFTRLIVAVAIAAMAARAQAREARDWAVGRRVSQYAPQAKI